jgi:hypothetical protein
MGMIAQEIVSQGPLCDVQRPTEKEIGLTEDKERESGRERGEA